MQLNIFYLLQIIFVRLNSLQNASFITATAELPIGLYKSIVSVYKNELFVVGGNLPNGNGSNSVYSLPIQNITNPNGSFDGFSSLGGHPNFTIIQCESQCAVTMNEKIYILQAPQMHASYGLMRLIIYDMQSKSFVPISKYPYQVTPLHPKPEVGLSYYLTKQQCIVSNNSDIFMLHLFDQLAQPGQNLGNKDFQYNLVKYDTINRTWTTGVMLHLSELRDNMGCVLIEDSLYFFGGVYWDWGQSSREATVIEKCLLNNGMCSIIEFMKYQRSNMQVTSVKIINPYSFFGDHITYIFIYGGTTIESQQNMDIFNVSNQQIVANVEQYIGLLTERWFGSALADDLLLFVGGKDIQDANTETKIKFINISPIFAIPEKIHQFQQSCITTYHPSQFIDKYLIDDNSLVWQSSIPNIFLVNGKGNAPFLNISVGYLSKNNAKYLRTMFWSRYEDSYFPFGYGLVINAATISRLTSIDFNNGYITFWAMWNELQLLLGLGDVPGSYQIHEHHMYDIYSMSVGKAGIHVFYSDSCSMTFEVTIGDATRNTFVMDDQIHVQYNLSQATSLNKVIHIKSNDIIGINHTMRILENSTCLLCLNNNDDHCFNCDIGIAISELSTYHTNNNSYSISVETEFKNILFQQPNPLHIYRIVQEVYLIIDMKSNDNETYDHGHDIYPNAKMFITPLYDTDEPTQHTGTFTINFDPDFRIGNDAAQISVDFHQMICQLEYNNIVIDCYEQPIIIPLSMQFKPKSKNNYGITVESNDVHLLNQTFFSFPRRVQTISIDWSAKLFLGEKIAMNVSVLDSDIYQNVSTIVISNANYSIYSTIQITYDYRTTEINHDISDSCAIETPNIGVSEPCSQGIWFRITENVIGEDIYLHVSSEDTHIGTEYVKIFVDDCDIGNEAIGDEITPFVCKPCESGTVGILRNSDCFSCQNINGIQCEGSKNLTISYNYWVTISDNANQIISNFCPAGLCCQNKMGCDYLQNINTNGRNKLCASNRNYTIPLCGGCNDGFSEVFGSNNCKYCKDDNYSYLLFPTMMAFVLILLLLTVDAPPNSEETIDKEITYSTRILVDDIKAIKLCILRPILYFAQAINFVTIQTGIWFYLAPLTKLLSLDILDLVMSSNESKKNNGICFYDGLTSIDKLLWHLFFPTCMFVALGIFFVINICIKFIYKKEIRFLNFGWNTVWSVFIILVGNIVSTMLKTLACSDVDSQFVHFYGGYKQCFGPIWITAAIFVVGIVNLWIVIWFLLYKMDENARDSRRSYLRTITKPFHLKYWYWEIVLTSRRICVAFLVTIQYIDYAVVQCILLVLLIMYGFAQYRNFPFNYNRANIMECLCIFLLIGALIIVIFEFHRTYPTLTSVIMTAIVILPLLLLLAYCILIVVRYINTRKLEKTAPNHNLDNHIRIQKFELRKTGSQRQMMPSQTFRNQSDEKLEVNAIAKVELVGINQTMEENSESQVEAVRSIEIRSKRKNKNDESISELDENGKDCNE
eukprot:296605_1